ncbi:MAG: 2-oxoglutarate dehydrogenase E1 component [Alphaproteobacteria bacterium]|nr:2-oxoglutarate dehydrogenase E1 component [Alphaproteobacteria bacterium]
MSDNLSFLTGINSEYIAHLYAKYLASPSSVDGSWQRFFSDLNDDEVSVLREMHGASWTPDENRKEQNAFAANTNEMGSVAPSYTPPPAPSGAPATSEEARKATLDSVRALMLIRAYRVRGHLEADLDPLGLVEQKYHPELDPKHYGFAESDYDRPIFIDGVLGMETATLRDILFALKETYCGKIGVEFMHMSDPEEKAWIQERIEEPHNKTEFTVNGKKAIYQRLVAAEGFEQFLHVKHTGTKRFGVDGGESLIPCIEQIMKRGGQLGLKEIAVGMAHRGRLNVLTNVMGKSYTAVFSEFQGQSSNPDDVQGSGDVKYHMGTSGDRDFDGNVVHLSLTANPSHLEFVNPVVIGKVRAKQVQANDMDAEQVLPLLLHGDAAFAGQGVVPETLMISDLPGYRVGGTMHIVINNQIGFTTRPKFSRSGPYCTDVAKMLSAPIFHVNGDDPESVVHVARIATEFRQKFKKDVVIDMFCYRRYGHNEGDEPSFTQPLMYKKIKTQKSTRELYGEQLVAEKVLTAEEAKQEVDAFQKYMEEAFEATKSYKPNKADFLEGAWSGLTTAPDGDRRGKTAVEMDTLKRIGQVLTTVPEDFKANSKILRQLKAKDKMMETGEGIDWGTAEALAFGTLLDDGFAVRLSGQDCGRGTFSQRHAILYDQETEKKYSPLKHVSPDQPKFEVHDSPLSELAVMGFEYGYSLADPKTLVMWEGQFGDFVNGAQVIIDQFISSGETKWLRMSGLVLMLPHGMEGQGPEHSSARLERFLQASAEDNWQVANCTTPANYFHILRRQMCRDFRKPLILMTPKSLLRHKLCVSNLEDFGPESSFHRILWDHDQDKLAKPDKIKRVVLCTGKVYYDLLQERRERDLKDVMILRLEQLYPFPDEILEEELAKYPNADVVWCQEEPKNMGSWFFVEPEIETVLVKLKHKAGRAKYAGRIAAASPATGLLKTHNEEQAALVDDALSVKG